MVVLLLFLPLSLSIISVVCILESALLIDSNVVKLDFSLVVVAVLLFHLDANPREMRMSAYDQIVNLSTVNHGRNR